MKIRIRKLRKIPKISLDVIVMLIALFSVTSFALLEHTSIPIPAFSSLKMPLLYVGGICIVTQVALFLKNILKKKYFFVLCILIIMSVCLMVSAFVNRDSYIGEFPLRTTVRVILFLLELFFIVIWAAEKGRSGFVLEFVFKYLFILTVITDLLFLTGIMRFAIGRHEYYLVGTKFSVSYLHINLLAFWYMHNNRKLFNSKKAKRIIFLGTPLLIMVTIHIDCITGLIGCLVLFMLFLISNTSLQKNILHLNSPLMLLFCLIASVVFPFVSERITTIPFVTFIVEDILGRDDTLTGRLNVFAQFAREIKNNWVLGYGFGNGDEAAVSLFGYANAQNALLHWILQGGLLTTAMLIILMMTIFYLLTKSRRFQKTMPLVFLIYVYIVIGMVETSFNMSFIMWFFLIMMLSVENESPNIMKSDI